MSGRRRVALLVVLAAVIAAPATVAWTYWSGYGDALKGQGAAGTATIRNGPVPTVARAGGSSATVRWGASVLSNGVPASGYDIRRYVAATGDEVAVGAGCSGRMTALICTEDGLALGSWRYTVTPIIGDHWVGPQSTESGAVSIVASTVVLDKRLFGPPLPAQTTGSMTGFAPGEPVAYSYGPDHTSIAGAPTVVDDSGSALITALAIPDIADGPHTIYVTGADSGVVASAGIVIDTTPPTVSPVASPAPNAAGWNRSAVEITGSVDDVGGSGVDFVKATFDGTDPRTSPTALLNPAPGVVTETMTLKIYGVDQAGNASAVLTLPLKIDMIPPGGAADVVELTGGAIVEASGTVAAPGFAFYRGVAPGSFRLRITMSDTGGSGPGTLGTSSLVNLATGWTHVPGATPTANPAVYLTNPFGWVAGTTSTPTGTATLTDVAGNTTVIAGGLVNDSAAPVGGSVTLSGLGGTGALYSNSQTLNLTLQKGTDAGSGLAATGSLLLRASAPLASSGGILNGLCGTYGGFAQVGPADPGSSVTDTVPDDDHCYRYTYSVPDRVGNTALRTSTDIKVQTSSDPSLWPSGVIIAPITGLVAQVVSGSTLYYHSADAGSFSVSASVSDAWSGVTQTGFPTFGGFSGGGTVTGPVSGTTFRTTYSWSNNGSSASPGSQAITANNNAGQSQSRPGAFSVVRDDAGPTQSLSLTGATGAFLSGQTLYYRPTASGTFKLVDAASDDGAGTASVSFPSLGLSGWTHNNQTVTTPAGGPYTSSSFSWNSFPSSPGGYTVTSVDRLGISSTITITFSQDQSPPSGVSISYPSASLNALSVPITLDDGTDGASGVNAASAIVKRDQATYNTANNRCGSFPNTFATTVTLVGGNDTSVSNARCYKYRYLISDNVGNQTTANPQIVVRIEL